MGARIASLRLLRQCRAARLDTRQGMGAPQMRTKAEQAPGKKANTMTDRTPYDIKCPRCIAAHEAGEKTALTLFGSGDFSPKYIAMAVVQDALVAYCTVPHGEKAHSDD